MSILTDCLAQAVKDGKLSAKGADEYNKRMADAEALAEQRGMAGPAAYEFAITEAAKAMEKAATGKRQQVQMTILAVDRAWAGANKNERGIGYGLTDVFSEHLFGKGSGVSIGQQHYGNLATLQSIMADYLDKVRSRAGGLKQNAVLPRHVVSALFGRDVSDPAAKEAAKAWDLAMTWWRDEMQKSGVFVRELADWRLPQHWDPAAVRAIGNVEYVAKMMQWWQDKKLLLRDFEADGQAYLVPGKADERARMIFGKAYDNITSGGDLSIEPGAMMSKTLADRFGRRRAFEWADDNSWLEFNRTFGVGDDAIGELMVRHLDRMSKDLAIAQVLGPDPDRAAKILTQMYRQQGGSRLWANKLETMYDMQSGKSLQPVSTRLALGAQSLRQFLASTQLGGALLSSASDFGFTKAVANWYGLDMTKLMAGYVANLAGKDQAQAMRDGLILEVGLRGLHTAAQDVIGDIRAAPGIGNKVDAFLNGASRVTGRMSEFVVRAQGLAHHTQVLRDELGTRILAKLGDLAPKSWDQLSGIEKRLFVDYGMGAKEWDVIRTKGLDQGFVNPAKLAREGEGAGVKLLGAIANIQRSAIPEGNIITRALMVGNTKPGTFEGEFLRSFAQYRGFPMGAFLMHYFRAVESLRDTEGQWFRGQYIASLVASTTVLGALSLQLKNLAAGKDPEPMYGEHGAKFWAEAAAQGGALGIVGNYMQSIFQAKRLDDPSRLLTPMGGLSLDTAQLVLGGLHGAANESRSETVGKQLAKMERKYIPGAGIWYLKPAVDRLVHDTVLRMADPDASGAFARMQERVRKEQATQFYYQPGSARPFSGNLGNVRAPDLGRAAP